MLTGWTRSMHCLLGVLSPVKGTDNVHCGPRVPCQPQEWQIARLLFRPETTMKV